MFQHRAGDKFYNADSNQVSDAAPASLARARARVAWLTIAYVAATCIYVTYSVSTQTGLGGYAIAIEMEIFGYSEIKATGVLLVILLNLPLGGLMAILQRVSPQLVCAGNKPLDRPKRNVTISWKHALLAGGVPLLATALAVPISYFIAHEELKESVYKLNLDDSSGSIPKGARLVELTGHAASRYVAAYREGDTDHVFVPVTGAMWTPGNAIQFVAYETLLRPGENDGFAMPDDLRQPGPSRVEGKISGFLPIVIARRFRAEGLQIAPTCRVVDKAGFPTASGVNDTAILTGIVGMTVTAILFFTTLLLKRMLRMSTVRSERSL